MSKLTTEGAELTGKATSMIEKHLGILVAGGKVVDVMMYEDLAECKDNLVEAIARRDPEEMDTPNVELEPLTQAVLVRIIGDTHNNDGWEVVAEVVL